MGDNTRISDTIAYICFYLKVIKLKFAKEICKIYDSPINVELRYNIAANQ